MISLDIGLVQKYSVVWQAGVRFVPTNNLNLVLFPTADFGQVSVQPAEVSFATPDRKSVV